MTNHPVRTLTIILVAFLALLGLDRLGLRSTREYLCAVRSEIRAPDLFRFEALASKRPAEPARAAEAASKAQARPEVAPGSASPATLLLTTLGAAEHAGAQNRKGPGADWLLPGRAGDPKRIVEQQGRKRGMNTAVSVFRNQYLDGTVAEITSQPIPMQGNKVVMAITMINISGASASYNFRLQGSYDGLAWVNLGSGKDETAFGYDSEAVASVDVAFVRVRAKNTAGTTPKAIFDVAVAMSAQ